MGEPGRRSIRSRCCTPECRHLNGYATGVYSSRRIEAATYESVAFRYIAANTQPDHDSLRTFRKRFLNEIEAPFVQGLCIARQTGWPYGPRPAASLGLPRASPHPVPNCGGGLKIIAAPSTGSGQASKSRRVIARMARGQPHCLPNARRRSRSGKHPKPLRNPPHTLIKAPRIGTRVPFFTQHSCDVA